jgi:hypothetical protein
MVRVVKSNGSKPKGLSNVPRRNGPLNEMPRRQAIGAAAGRSAERREPSLPRKPKVRREVFEGDVAAVELRSALAKGQGRALVLRTEPIHAPPPARVTAFTTVIRFMGAIAIAAATAGVAGYLLGNVRLTMTSARVAPSSAEAGAAGAATNFKPASGNPRPVRSAEQAASLEAPAAALAATDAPDIAIRTARPSPPAEDANEIASRPRPRSTESASDIAVRMKVGEELMAAGDIVSARRMFERAGGAAGAFALAETYDPVVLKSMRVRGITPDPALARRWYERARDMGSTVAPQRIRRLSQNSR